MSSAISFVGTGDIGPVHGPKDGFPVERYTELVRPTMLDILHCAARHQVPVLCHDGTPPYCTTFQIAAMARWVRTCRLGFSSSLRV